MVERSDKKSWNDFNFTIDVILATALARDDLAQAREGQASTFKFTLLAAADSEVPAFPASGWRDTRQFLSTALVEKAGELRMSFQAVGYAAMTRVAGKAARMVSADGEIEVAFRFDNQARGIAVLADTAAVRHALTDFLIVLE